MRSTLASGSDTVDGSSGAFRFSDSEDMVKTMGRATRRGRIWSGNGPKWQSSRRVWIYTLETAFVMDPSRKPGSQATDGVLGYLSRLSVSSGLLGGSQKPNRRRNVKSILGTTYY